MRAKEPYVHGYTLGDCVWVGLMLMCVALFWGSIIAYVVQEWRMVSQP